MRNDRRQNGAVVPVTAHSHSGFPHNSGDAASSVFFSFRTVPFVVRCVAGIPQGTPAFLRLCSTLMQIKRGFHEHCKYRQAEHLF